MAEVTQTTILDIQTGQSVKSVKDLKQQIKDLKDRIVELTAAGEDCSEEYAELGTSMRQLKDINEEATRSSKDLGDQLAVVTGSMKGVAGAIGTVSGVMALMGNESEKATKLLKTMASAMSITTGIQAMESGAKSIKALVGGMVTAAKGAKTLGAAMKAAFSTNPVGLLVTALTGVITVIGSITSKAKEAAKEIKENIANSLAAEAEEIKNYWLSNEKFVDATSKLHRRMTREQVEFLNSSTVEGVKAAENILSRYIASGKYQKTLETLIQQRENVLKKSERELIGRQMEANAKMYEMEMKYGDDVKKYNEEQIKEFQNITNEYNSITFIRIREIEKMAQIYSELQNKLPKDNPVYDDLINKQGELRTQYVSLANEFIDRADKVNDAWKNMLDAEKAAADAESEANKQAYEQAKQNAAKLLALDKQTASDRLKLAQLTAEEQRENEQDALTERFRNMEISEGEYQSGMLGIELKYYADSEEALQNYIADMEAIREKWNKSNLLSAEQKNTIFSEIDLKETLSQIRELQKSATDAEYEYLQKVKEAMYDTEEADMVAEIQSRINEIKQNALQNRLEIEAEYYADSYILHRDANMMELELLQKQADEEEFLWNTFVEENGNKMRLLNERFSDGLIGQADFNEQMGALGQEYVERERQHSQTVIDIKKGEFEAKKGIAQMYIQFESSLASSLSSILNTMADASEDNLEQQKKIRVAATWVDTLQGSIAGFVSALESLPYPYNLIAGGATAASVIAQGILTTQKIMATTKDNTPSMSSNSINTFTTPQVATIATGATNDFTNIMGNAVSNAQGQQRVYVLLNDINSAQGRMVSVVQDNTF